jgi:hypothetical protein
VDLAASATLGQGKGACRGAARCVYGETDLGGPHDILGRVRDWYRGLLRARAAWASSPGMGMPLYLDRGTGRPLCREPSRPRDG